MIKINQFHDGTAVGDAVTNQMLLLQDLLRKEGYESEIYAEHIPNELSNRIRPISKYKGCKENILLVHHSMGFDLFDQIISYPDKKVLIYHNITPEKFFTDEGIRKYIRIGLKQAKDYKKYVEYAVADSNYNRKELYAMGYKNVDVMPINISLDRFESLTHSEQILEKYSNQMNILFVGRVVPNKRQEDIIDIFNVYQKYFNSEAKLLLVGDLGFETYVNYLKQKCNTYGILDKIDFLGKVTESELKSCYESADIFLCMSEHEGFGVPILEAMKMGVPVIAFDSSAISETMGGAGILLREKDFNFTAALIDEVMNDKSLYSAIIENQYRRLEKQCNLSTKDILLHIIKNVESRNRIRSIQMQGPFETSYSLAIVNRRLIETLDEKSEDNCSIYCTEGPGDYIPKEEDLKDKPNAKRLWMKSKHLIYPDVTIRNMYPPRVNDADGALNFSAFGWEENVLPQEYVENFNKYLNGIGTMSDFVTDTLKKSGVTVPVETMGIGVELCKNFENIKPYKIKNKPQTTFLHISSAFPRKGVDLLLRGYYEEFSGDDDVCLILKTFPNPHNTTVQLIEQLNLQFTNPPRIEHINKDLSPEELCSLYKACDCYVQMSRGEGFGLPVAEAMLAKKPVIVSNNTGMSDFCNEDTALIVDYTFEKANSHLSTQQSEWAKPNVNKMRELMRTFVENSQELCVEHKIDEAYNLISTKFSWNAVADRWMNFIDKVESRRVRPRVALVSTWNTKCGIAEYSRLMVEEMQSYVEFEIYANYGDKLIRNDEVFVKPRVWHSAFQDNVDKLINELLLSSAQIVHIQFNFGFFKLDDLAKLINEVSIKKKILITFHKVADSDVGGKTVSLSAISAELNKCMIIVHQEAEVTEMVNKGVNRSNIKIVPLGQLEYVDYGKRAMRDKLGLEQKALILSSYGFLLPHKGISEVIKAIPKLKKQYGNVMYLVTCALHSAPQSQMYFDECKKIVKNLQIENSVKFITDFLPNDKSIQYLQASDICIMPYLPSKESASGAIRFCIAANRPIIATNQHIFGEFKKEIYQIDKADANLIANAVNELSNTTLAREYVRNMQEYISRTNWRSVTEKIYQLYSE